MQVDVTCLCVVVLIAFVSDQHENHRTSAKNHVFCSLTQLSSLLLLSLFAVMISVCAMVNCGDELPGPRVERDAVVKIS